MRAQWPSYDPKIAAAVQRNQEAWHRLERLRGKRMGRGAAWVQRRRYSETGAETVTHVFLFRNEDGELVEDEVGVFADSHDDTLFNIVMSYWDSPALSGFGPITWKQVKAKLRHEAQKRGLA
jgi:hypothetical protein